MGDVLSSFARAFEASPAVALAAAFGWGILSVLLSPCHLSSVPLLVAYMTGSDAMPTRRRAALVAGSFALGLLASIAGVGAATAWAGRALGDLGPAGSWILAAVFLVAGLDLLGILSIPALGRRATVSRRGPGGAALLGLVFGAALGPCTFAFLAPLLGLAFRAGPTSALRGAALVVAFGVGHAATVVAAGTSAQGVQRWLAWKAGARGALFARRLAGLAAIACGLYFLGDPR